MNKMVIAKVKPFEHTLKPTTVWMRGWIDGCMDE
jgi:hypothetical protein